MELEYGEICEERCREIDSWEIHDPYGYGEVFTAERIKFVTNEDESILFYCAFMPTHDDYDRYYSIYLLIREKETVLGVERLGKDQKDTIKQDIGLLTENRI